MALLCYLAMPEPVLSDSSARTGHRKREGVGRRRSAILVTDTIQTRLWKFEVDLTFFYTHRVFSDVNNNVF